MASFPMVLGDLLVNNTSLTWRRKHHSFDEIQHISFSWEIHRIKINGIPGENEGGMLEIILKSGDKIQKIYGQHGAKTAWQAIVPFYNTIAKTHNNCQILASACQFLCTQTYKQRLDYYVKQLEKYGHFFYDNKNFFIDGRVIDSKSNVFNLRDKLQWSTFELTLSKPATGLAQKVASELWKSSSSNLVISTKTDKDVFRTLIDYLLKQFDE